MTEKQKRFVEEYLIDCNATKAAIRAGYSPKTAKQTGCENLAKPDLRAYLDEKLAQMHSEKVADAQEVMEYLTSVMRGEHTEQVLKLVGDGMQTVSNIEVGAKDRIKCAELLGKRYGMFKEGLSVELEQITLVDDLKE